jgi:hypothetical protein
MMLPSRSRRRRSSLPEAMSIEVRMARCRGMMGVVRSRASASIREGVGSSWGLPDGPPALSLGWGVPMSSGGGEPATEERGVVSPSPLAPRWAGRPRGRGLEGVAVARGVPRGLAGFTGAATTVEGMFCLA